MAQIGDNQLELLISGDRDADIEDAGRRLRDDLDYLTQLKVDSFQEAAPANAKAGELVSIGHFILSVLGPAGIGASLVSVLRDWLSRNKGFKLRVKLPDGSEVELSGVDPEKLSAISKLLKASHQVLNSRGR